MTEINYNFFSRGFSIFGNFPLGSINKLHDSFLICLGPKQLDSRQNQKPKTQSWKRVKNLHQCFFMIQKFTPKVRNSRQIQCYQKCPIRNKFDTIVPRKQCKTPGNSVKHKERGWNSHKHFWFPGVFTPLFITFSTKFFTPVGNFLH